VDSDGAVIWANDTFTRTYIVKPNVDGSFDVTEIFDGTFTTLASATPLGAYGDESCKVMLNAGITGQFYGNEAFGPTGLFKTIPGLDFNLKATCPGECTASQFFSSIITGADAPLSVYAWQFHYSTPNNGVWNNTDHGNNGDLH
jgi:hypothetical protein